MIRGTKRNFDAVSYANEKHIDASIHNRFEIEVIDAVTGKIKQTAKAYNVVCNQLFTRLCSGNTYFNYIQYGSGTGTPSTADTSLFERIGDAAVTYSTNSLNYKTGVYSVRQYIQLTAATAAGKTITEVGISHSSGNGSLCTHAMLQDMNGNPVSIQKTDTDVVNIYATVFVHFDPYGYDNGCLRMYYWNKSYYLPSRFAGVSNTYLPNLARISSSFGVSHTSSSGGFYPANSTYGDTSGYTGLTSTWDSAKRTLTLKMTRLEASSFNIGGIRHIYLFYESGNNYVTSIPLLIISTGGSWFPYSLVENEAVGTGDGSKVDFALDFPFAHDVKVFIDGVETTDFTVDYAPQHYGNDTYGRGYMYNMDWLRLESTQDNHIPHFDIQGSFNGTRQFYNPAYELGIASFDKGKKTTIYASDDLSDWIEISPSANSNVNLKIPEEHQHHKYWRGVSTDDAGGFGLNAKPPSTFNGNVLHFSTPPADGAVIVASYKTDCIAKDANHVFDMSVTFHFGEYTEAQ